MQRIEEIESALQKLSSVELQQFRVWYSAFDATLWDEEFERHTEQGKLDALADQTLADFAKGRCTEL